MHPMRPDPDLVPALASALARKGMSMRELARRSGSPLSVVGRILRGDIDPRATTQLRAVCRALGIGPLAAGRIVLGGGR